MTSFPPHLEKLSSATGAAETAIGAAAGVGAGLFSENTSTSRLAAVAGAGAAGEEELPRPSRSGEEATAG